MGPDKIIPSLAGQPGAPLAAPAGAPATAVPAANDANFAMHDSPRTATTASMQNLLAQYFETQHFDQAATHQPFEATRVHALSSHASETRASETRAGETPGGETGDQLAPLLPQLQALVPTVSMPPVAAEVEAPADDATESWPVSAKALIDSLMAENERLRARLHDEAEARQQAETQADSDVLTPTLNRRAFLREMHRAMADCRRYGEQACLIFLDMDGFKSINDTYGHAAGDAALCYVAEALKTSVREGDSVGRMGGDEFAVLLRRADLHSTRIKAMKLEAELALGTFEYNGLYLKVGGSFGVRPFADQPSAETWLSEADAAMFLVKKASR